MAKQDFNNARYNYDQSVKRRAHLKDEEAANPLRDLNLQLREENGFKNECGERIPNG
jgi:hypothetical protein